MIRYRYNRDFVPPTPLVHVTLRRPDGANELPDQPAQLDTAADRTVLPMAAVEELGLVELSELPVAGFGGQVSLAPTFLVQLQIRGLGPMLIEAIASAGETYVLLGRDILNSYRVVLDGPQLSLEIH